MLQIVQPDSIIHDTSIKWAWRKASAVIAPVRQLLSGFLQLAARSEELGSPLSWNGKTSIKLGKSSFSPQRGVASSAAMEANGTEAACNASGGPGWDGVQQETTWGTIALVVLLSIIVAITVVGNILVLLAVATHRSLQTLSNVFLVSLCVSDLLVGALVAPPAVAITLYGEWGRVGALVAPPAVAVTLYGEWIFSPGFCAVWVSFDVMLCSASILNLCVISLDRYIQITRPLQHDVYMTNTRAGILIALAWLLAIFASFPPITRYIQITRPLQHDVYMTNTRAGILIALAWLLAIFASFPPITRYIQITRPLQHDVYMTNTQAGILIALAWLLAIFAAFTPITLTHSPHICSIAITYIQITRPLQHDIYMTNTRAGILIALAWLLAIFASFPPITLGWHEHAGHPSLSDLTAFTPQPQCIFDPSKTYALTASIVTFYIPLAAILFTYSRIYKEARSQATRVASLNKQFRSESRRRNGKRGSQPIGPASTKAIRTLGVLSQATRVASLNKQFRNESRRKNGKRGSQPIGPASTKAIRTLGVLSQATRVASLNKQFRNESRRRNGKRGSQPIGPASTKAIRTLGVILGAFMVTWLPFFVSNVVRPFCKCVPGEVFEGLTWLGWCNSTMNPIIYPLFIKDFKQVFRKYLPCFKRAPPGGGNAMGIGELPGPGPVPGPSTSNDNGGIEINTVAGNVQAGNCVPSPALESCPDWQGLHVTSNDNGGIEVNTVAGNVPANNCVPSPVKNVRLGSELKVTKTSDNIREISSGRYHSGKQLRSLSREIDTKKGLCSN
ncbi:G-protein coupled receptor [Branchiostoma belcheri]|nr:G-protein coupled receptor [Branchiostoma belcheri]